MKSTIKRLAAATAIVAIAGTSAFAEDAKKDSEYKFEKAANYYAQCQGATNSDFEKIKEKVKAFTDAEIMAETVNDPEKFFALMAIVNDPHTINVMANCATEPVMWDTWMRNGTDMNKMTSAMTRMMNPAGMMKWMMAPMNPKVWQSMMAHMNAEKYTKWTVAMANPAFYSPAASMMDPQWYESRIGWMSNPESFAPFYSMFSMFGTTPKKEKPVRTEQPAQ